MSTVVPHHARRSFGSGMSAALATIGLCVAICLGTADDAAADITGLSVQATGPARYFPATDDRVHLEYDLISTNGLQADATLESLVVRAGKRTVLELGQAELAHITHPLKVGANTPAETIPGGASVVSLVDVDVPKRTRDLPGQLTSVVRYSFAPGPLGNLVDRNRVSVRTPVAGRAPLIVASPLRGAGWWASNACCDPDGSHRSGLLALDGIFTIVEAFAIDFQRITDAGIFAGDGMELTDFYAYGEPIHNVAPGKVVAVHRGIPDALWPPPESGPPNPAVKTSADYTGNSVIVKVAPHRFALYAHMVPGSIRVKRGERLETGQVVGELGNSGNSFAPHLHFAIQSKPSPFAGSRPYVFDRFHLEGSGRFDPSKPESGQVLITPDARQVHDVYPLAGVVATFGEG